MDDLSVAYLIDAAAKQGDPMNRFVAALSPELRTFAVETIRLRDEFTFHSQSVLSLSDPQASILHADWLATHGHEVAYRWSNLLRSMERWAVGDVRRGVDRAPEAPGAAAMICEDLSRPGHLCVSNRCRFFRHEHVGPYCISTVGDYWPSGASRRDTNGQGRGTELHSPRVVGRAGGSSASG